MTRRVTFLLSLIENPQGTTLSLHYCTSQLLAALIAALIVLGNEVGWNVLLQTL